VETVFYTLLDSIRRRITEKDKGELKILLLTLIAFAQIAIEEMV
jgi:hypothetical protein